MDTNVDKLLKKYLKRAAMGIEKYGVTTDRDDLRLLQWMVHLQQELMDATIYIEAAMKTDLLDPSAQVDLYKGDNGAAALLRHWYLMAEKANMRMEEEIAHMEYALEMIAGEKPCVDDLLGNVEIAQQALQNVRQIRVRNDG